MMVKIFFLCCIALSLFAHQTGLSYLNLHEQENHEIELTYKKPLSDTRVMDIHIAYPQRCTQIATPKTVISNGFIVTKSALWCGKEGLQGSRIWVQGLVRSDRGILIRYEKGDFIAKEIIRQSTPFISLEKQQSSLEVMREYSVLGIFHILSGYDHLMFVLLLFLLSRNFKSLLYTISAFTLAHSITLSCGILGIVYVPPPVTEALIALSIVFLAKELLIQEETFTKRHLGVVAFSFGLLHGFGFSSVLQDIGLPHNEIPLSLFSFNLGIELGQIFFILVVSLFVYLLQYIHISLKVYERFLAYFVGTMAAFWFIQRVFAF